jgi:L,D-transpeptidase ErfK/SrfK
MRTNLISTDESADNALKLEELRLSFLHRLGHGILVVLIYILKKIWAIRSLIYLALFLTFIFWGIPKLQTIVMDFSWKHKKEQLSDEKTTLAYTNDLIKVTDKLSTKFNNLVPHSTYLVINSTENEFFLYKNRELIRTGRCSTGSYIVLKSVDSKEWIFKTPKGMFSIKGKVTNPVWKKPDWAFVEEGLPIPSANHPSRYEYGVLGDYALSLGDGYMLHGTLYKRFIGLPVTHGCIRLGDDDLKFIYNSLSIGSKVIIY